MTAGVAACGGEGATRFSGADRPQAGGGGTLSYALPPAAVPADPLFADSPAEQTIARQLFEPLTGRLGAPYGRRGASGIALRWRHSGDLLVWTFWLRPGIRFRDGELLDAAAVRANADRWRLTEPGLGLLPGLIAADAPSPTVVRLILAVPVARLPERLEDPRLGLVSPADLAEVGGVGELAELGAGSGPFELRSTGEGRIVLARWSGWWGSDLGLGPALDEVAFESRPTSAERFAALRAGEVRVAAGLAAAELAELRRNPLLAAVSSGQPGEAVGFERSVRGIDHAEPASLSGVWLALLGDEG